MGKYFGKPVVRDAVVESGISEKHAQALASVRDVRMVLNVLRHMTSDLKRGGVPVQMNQHQEDGFLKLELLIPMKPAKK